jgi:hypothetical protein
MTDHDAQFPHLPTRPSSLPTTRSAPWQTSSRHLASTPEAPPGKTAARLAAVIAGLLDPGSHLIAPEEPRIHRALITSAGCALARHGLTVALDVLDISQAFYDIYSELRITNPARPERGIATLSSDAAIYWETRAQPGHPLDAIAAAIMRNGPGEPEDARSLLAGWTSWSRRK